MNTICSKASPICLNIVNAEMDGPKLSSHRGGENTYNAAECFLIAVESLLIVWPNITNHYFASRGVATYREHNILVQTQNAVKTHLCLLDH